MKGQLRIDQMFAFVAVDEDGTEGIPAFDGGGIAYPLVGADLDRIDQLRPLAQALAERLGTRVELVIFSQREHREWINP